MGRPDPYGLIGFVQTVLAYHYVVYSADWLLPDVLPPLSPAPQDLAAAVRPLEPASWAEVLLAVQIETPRGGRGPAQVDYSTTQVAALLG